MNSLQNTRFNPHLEALRGVAALMVVFRHLSLDLLDNHIRLGDLLHFPIPIAHIFVMVFFMLSGYVIGTTYPPQQTPFNYTQYLKKRFLRIYPVYFLVIIGCVLLIRQNRTDIAGSLFFLQVALTDNLTGNDAMWSLNHEVLYYLLFLVVVATRASVWVMLALSLATGCLSMLFPSLHPLFSAYGLGFFFWLTGLAMAWLLAPETPEKAPETHKFMLPMVLLLCCGSVLNPLYGLIPTLPYNKGVHLQDHVNVYDLAIWLFCFAAVLVFSGKKMPAKKWVIGGSYLIPALYIALLVVRHRNFDYDTICYTGLYALALVLPLVYRSSGWTSGFLYLGSISYSLYIVHMPVLYLLKNCALPLPPYTAYCLKLVLFAGITWALSHVLEKKIQPLVKKYTA